MLPILAGMEILVLKGRALLSKGDNNCTVNQKVRLPPGHVWLLQPLNQEANEEDALPAKIRRNWVAASERVRKDYG